MKPTRSWVTRRNASSMTPLVMLIFHKWEAVLEQGVMRDLAVLILEICLVVASVVVQTRVLNLTSVISLGISLADAPLPVVPRIPQKKISIWNKWSNCLSGISSSVPRSRSILRILVNSRSRFPNAQNPAHASKSPERVAPLGKKLVISISRSMHECRINSPLLSENF